MAQIWAKRPKSSYAGLPGFLAFSAVSAGSTDGRVYLVDVALLGEDHAMHEVQVLPDAPERR